MNGNRSQNNASKTFEKGKSEHAGSVQLKISFMRKHLFNLADVNLEYRCAESYESGDV